MRAVAAASMKSASQRAARVASLTLVSLGVVACAAKVSLPTESQPAVEAQPAPEPEVAVQAPDLCEGRSLDGAVHEAQAALDAGALESAEQLGLAIEQALACEVRARRWQLELDAVSLLARLDPLAEPQPQRCRLNSEGVCVYREHEKRDSADPPAPAYDELARARLDAYARYEAEAAPGEALRSIRDRHIRVRLHHRDFTGALPLLQSYVVDYHEHPDAQRAAVLLVDTQVMTWPNWRDEGPFPSSGTGSLAWFDRLETLALWNDPAAVELHMHIAELRPGAMWRAAMEARDEAVREWKANVEAGLPRPYEVAGFRRCAELFLAIASAYENHDRSATLWWNAGNCYEANYDFGRAYAARITLLSRHPDSEHARDTLYFVAEQDHWIARYDQAEDHYLEFARRYPKDDRSRDALAFAYHFGAALGHDTSEIVDAYVEREIRRDIQHAGYFVWETRPKDPQRLLEFAEEFFHTFGMKAGLPSFEAIEVSARLHWAQACRGRLDDDRCVEPQTAVSTNQCSLGGVPLPDVRARSGERADQARARIRSMGKRFKGLKPKDYGWWRWDDLGALKAAELEAASAFLLLEPDLEDYLLAGPDAPDARERAEQLDARYLEVAALGQIEFAIRAHARRGLVWELLASSGLRVHEGTCRPITRWANDDRKRALAGYADCLALAVEQQHFNDAASRCEAKLAGEQPERVPALVELFGEPGLLPTTIEPSGVQG